MSPSVIVVAGTSSEVGKTTLVCDLLAKLRGWEAIKLTRGHYRSCGKHVEACCVSHLLGAKATVYSEPKFTRVPGKDTDRFWTAGASAVHWVVARSDQVEEGLGEAVSRVRAEGVVVEGTSALAFLMPAFSILVASGTRREVKPSARRALQTRKIDAVYLADTKEISTPPILSFCESPSLRFFTAATRDELIATAITRAGFVPVSSATP